jgi:translation elongation factor EF-Ts
MRGRMSRMSADAVDAKLIMELRRRTGLPVHECKRALADAGGDIDVATKTLESMGVDRFNLPGLRREAEALRNQQNNPPSAQ